MISKTGKIAILATALISFASIATACSAIKDNIGTIAGGASALASAPQVRDAIVEWIDGDEIATNALEGPGEFFGVGYRVLTERGADIPLVQLAADSPDYVDQIPMQWDTMLAAFNEFEARSGKPRPLIVQQFIANGEAAYRAGMRAIEANDRFQKACGIYAMSAPLAGLVSPIPLPSKIPGCPNYSPTGVQV